MDQPDADRRIPVMHGPVTPAILTQIVLGACSGGAMAYAAYVLIAPLAGPPPLFPFQDKVFHAVCFAVLTGPAVLVLPRRVVGFWVAHMVALGVGIEVVQAMWLPGRTGSVVDLAADVAGIAAATFVARAVQRMVVARDAV